MTDATPESGHSAAREESAAELVRKLSEQTTLLVRQELELAKAELSAKGKQAGIGAGMFGAAGMVGLYAVGALTACLILLLTKAVDTWVAALIVTGAYAGLAAILAFLGRSRLRRGVPPVPEQTVESVKEDVAWTKQRITEARS